MKQLSVVIPLYNSAKWLPKCLDSVLNQDVAENDMEIICINDGSPDESERIAKQYQKVHPDSIVVLTQENLGPSGARNNGMSNAKGKYLCFVDPDDFVEPNVFGGLLKQMERQQLDMLRFNYYVVDEDYHLVKKRDFEQSFDYSPSVMSGAEFLASRLDIACNIWRYFYRRELIVNNQIWFFTGDYFDDTPWLPLVLIKTERLGVCDTVAYDYQERSDSLVKAKSLSAIKRKAEGSFLLMHLLQEEMKGIGGRDMHYPSMKVLHSINLYPSVQKGVVQWYERMLAHTTISLLKNVSVYNYESISVTLKRVRGMKVFPLSVHGVSLKNRILIELFNRFPELTCFFLHLKNK